MIAIWDLQPWQATCESLHSMERTLLKREKGSWKGTVNKESIEGTEIFEVQWLFIN